MWVIFSHYIPCTLENHECAATLKDFSIQTDWRIVVGYHQVFTETDEAAAVGLLGVGNIDVVQFSREDIREWRKTNGLPL
ncbi:hypothetical protein DPMN_178367 [Dreissena polymorpha]|uniref:Uncharacterized protein n=1 Tax=Dreissena polymorpha TaxID=45954 RepID=A0A9D4EC23_DREPO|nr:hypothetical protein DPMN_178367 [Dreissena polymorpha]